MIDYVFAVVVGALSAAAAGYAYRAAKASERLVEMLQYLYYYGQQQQQAQHKPERVEPAQPQEPETPRRAEEEGVLARVALGDDYISSVTQKIVCVAELLKGRGGCAPLQEVDKCGLARHIVRAVFKVADGEVCLKT